MKIKNFKSKVYILNVDAVAYKGYNLNVHLKDGVIYGSKGNWTKFSARRLGAMSGFKARLEMPDMDIEEHYKIEEAFVTNYKTFFKALKEQFEKLSLPQSLVENYMGLLEHNQRIPWGSYNLGIDFHFDIGDYKANFWLNMFSEKFAIFLAKEGKDDSVIIYPNVDYSIEEIYDDEDDDTEDSPHYPFTKEEKEEMVEVLKENKSELLELVRAEIAKQIQSIDLVKELESAFSFAFEE